MPRIVVAEDSHTQAVLIRFHLQKAGFEVRVAGDGVEALAAVAAAPPDLVLTDMQMPNLDGLGLVRKLRESQPSLPVVLMTSGGCVELELEALRSGAAHYASKECIETDVVPTVQKVLRTAAEAGDEPLGRVLFGSDLHVVLGADLAHWPQVLRRVRGDLASLALTRETVRIGVALTEAVTNAVVHGCLKVGARPRQGDIAAYDALYASRLQDAPYRDRCVRFQAKLSPQEALFVVQDEGPGFHGLRDLPDPANFDAASGRGLVLLRTLMDEVRFNAAGNEVTLVKRRERA
jgi:CheY-like chemotaxis protein/anti-sigma regulatory factor (Ser/Thr protein kinase)